MENKDISKGPQTFDRQYTVYIHIHIYVYESKQLALCKSFSNVIFCTKYITDRVVFQECGLVTNLDNLTYVSMW